MSVSFRRRSLVLVVTLTVALGGGAVALITSCERTHSATGADFTPMGVANKPTASRRTGTVITIDAANTGRVIARGFLGVSLEFPTIIPYAGSDPRAINP